MPGRQRDRVGEAGKVGKGPIWKWRAKECFAAEGVMKQGIWSRIRLPELQFDLDSSPAP